MEQLLKHVLLLLTYHIAPTEIKKLESSQIDKNTLGEVVRLIKTQQKDSPIFQQADRRAAGELFRVLDNIFLLRNKLIHVKIPDPSERAKTELRALLKYVDEFCNSWLLVELLGER